MFSRGTALSYVSRLALAGLIISIMVLVIVISVVNGFERELRTNVLGFLPHMTVFGFGGMTTGEIERIAPGDAVAAVAPFIQGTGLITANGQAKGIAITGIESESYARVSRMMEFLETGAGREIGDARYGTILGRRLADTLGVSVGDKVVLVLPSASVTPAGVHLRKRSFTIVDLFSSQTAFEGEVVYIAIRDAQKLFRLRDRVHGAHVKLNDLFATSAGRDELARQLPSEDVRIRSWVSAQGNLYQAIAVQKLTMFILLSFLIAVAAFNLVSGLVMIVEQRKSDIAILRSMGADSGLVIRLFCSVGVCLSAAGIIAGIAFGSALAASLPWIYRFATETFALDLMTQYFISYLPIDIRPLDIVGIAVTALVMSTVATLYPAWRAAKQLPSPVLAHE